jgi:hypothetical protein
LRRLPEFLNDCSVETIAYGTAIREILRLRRRYGPGHWRKRKGVCWVELHHGKTRLAEFHWYEATGVGRYEFKIKRFFD